MSQPISRQGLGANRRRAVAVHGMAPLGAEHFRHPVNDNRQTWRQRLTRSILPFGAIIAAAAIWLLVLGKF